MKTFRPNLSYLRKSFFLLGITCCLVQETQAQQQTPRELGKTMLRAFGTGSVDSIMQMQLTFEEVIAFTKENGIDMDTGTISNFRKTYPLSVEKNRSRYTEIMDEGLQKKSDWLVAKTDSVTVQKHEIKMTAQRNPMISKMTVYFHVEKKKYRLVSDIYDCKGVWKLGTNVDLFNDSLKKN